MKYRRTLRFHGLRRPRIRQTWNKYNLYNLASLRIPNTTHMTFFQQKWMAKALLRGYHGEHVKEKKWERMFSRRLLSVVNMNPRYMAAQDGSEQAAGRGSGRERPPPQLLSSGSASASASAEDGGGSSSKWDQLMMEQNNNYNYNNEVANNVLGDKATPYMNMTFAPLERRLDTAIFRALFASSARQARQMVVHGAVKVNGLKITHPSYLLNPGDMFQVDVERVLTATGRKRRRGVGRERWRKKLAKRGQALDAAAEAEEDAVTAEADAAEEVGEVEASDAAEEAVVKAEEQQEAAEEEEEEEALDEAAAKKAEIKELKDLRLRAKNVLAEDGELTVKRKHQLRFLVKRINKAMSAAGRRDPSLRSSSSSSSVVDDLATLLAKLEISPAEAKAREEEAAAAAAAAEEQGNLTEAERERLAELLREDALNPLDESKPYRTPWVPRRYMAPFAFIPPYLEVNQKICAAVYLRHPVARQGYAEVPTPFPPSLTQLAFNWYLRRG